MKRNARVRLVSLMGLPGSGKSTLAGALARRLRFMRVDRARFTPISRGAIRLDVRQTTGSRLHRLLAALETRR